MTVIRRAEPRDAPSVARILNALIRDTTVTFNPTQKTEEEVVMMFLETEVFLVAEADNSIIGYASYNPFRKGTGYAGVKEHSICLEQGTRGQGTGTALLNRLERIARREGVRHIVAGVSGENSAGLKFHAKHGFVEVGKLPGIGHKFGRDIDLILMQKSL